MYHWLKICPKHDENTAARCEPHGQQAAPFGTPSSCLEVRQLFFREVVQTTRKSVFWPKLSIDVPIYKLDRGDALLCDFWWMLDFCKDLGWMGAHAHRLGRFCGMDRNQFLGLTDGGVERLKSSCNCPKLSNFNRILLLTQNSFFDSQSSLCLQAEMKANP